MELTIKIKPNWAGGYRLEYDGKYITLFGKDRNFPYWFKPDPDAPDEYEEMVLVPLVCEVRNVSPFIKKTDKKYIYIDINP